MREATFPEVTVATPRRRRRPFKISRVGLYVLAILFAFFAFFPMLWILDTSLKPQAQVQAQPLAYLPSALSIQSYIVAFAQEPFARYYLNSVICSVAATVACLGLAALAGYAIARLRFRGKRLVLIGILAFSFFPPITQLVPLYNFMLNLGLLNNYLGLIIPYTFQTLPLAIWLLSAFLRDIPRELEEAAMVDGTSRLGAFWRVILPISAPGFVTAGIIVFVFDWNEFLYALTFMTQGQLYTIPVGIERYQGQFTFPWGTISAATVTAVIPLVLIILLFQRRLITGLTAGAVK
ncbi:MAG: carbohydrate ABC transporter permease [Candidatus Dormibacteraceae bacterium]